MLWRSDNSDRSATRFSFFLLKMSKRNIGIATGSSIFELLSHYAVKDAWTGGLSRFLITVSLRSKGSMDHTNVFRFVNVLYREHKYQSTSDGHKSHLCFPIIANRKTNRRWFGSLFVFPTDTKRESNRRHVQNRLFFWVFLFLFDAANEKWK